MQVVLCTMLRECCRVYAEFPSAITSIIGGSGARHFRKQGIANLISIYPRLHDGTPAAYIRQDDVQIVVSSMDNELLHVKVRLDIASDGSIMLEYTLDDDCDQFALTKLRVCARVCGALLVDLCVHIAAFNGRAANRFCSQHTLAAKIAGRMAIHPAGTHLVVSDTSRALLLAYGLPEMKLLTTLNICCKGPDELFFTNAGALCFTDAGTLIVTNWERGLEQLQHWTLEGCDQCNAAVRTGCKLLAEWVDDDCKNVRCMASRGDKIAVGTGYGVLVLNLKDDLMLPSISWSTDYILAVAFVDADTLAVSNQTRSTIRLYTLYGKLLKHIASGITSNSLAVCADGCLLTTDFYQRCIRVFTPDCEELPFPTHLFQSRPHTVALCGARAYVLDLNKAFLPPRICVFKTAQTKPEAPAGGNLLGQCKSFLLWLSQHETGPDLWGNVQACLRLCGHAINKYSLWVRFHVRRAILLFAFSTAALKY